MVNGVGPLSAVAEQIRAAAEEESRRRLTHGAPPPPPPIDIVELLKQWGQGVYQRTVGFPEYMRSVPLPDISDITGGRALNLAAGFVGSVAPKPAPGHDRGAVGPLEEFVGGLKREAGTRLPTIEEQLASVARMAARHPEAAAAARAQRQAAEQQSSARLAQERVARGGPVPQPQPRTLEAIDRDLQALQNRSDFSTNPEEIRPLFNALQQERNAAEAAILRAPAPQAQPQARARPSAQFGTRAQQKKVETLFKGIAKRPESFQFKGAPESANIDDIVAHYSSDRVPLEARVDNQFDKIVLRNKETGGILTIQRASTPRPYISSSGAESAGKEMGGGKQMYQAAMSWITNQGKRLAPDPSGISTINVLRKLENATASYLRHGKGGYIDLSNVTEAKGVQQMMVASQEHVFRIRPDLGQNLTFNGERFMNPAGTPLSDETLQVMIKAKDPKFQQGIGVATLKRAAMTRWALGASKEDVIEAAKRFKEPVLYSLAGLFVIKGQRRETD